jgi:hypothetical protein
MHCYRIFVLQHQITHARISGIISCENARDDMCMLRKRPCSLNVSVKRIHRERAAAGQAQISDASSNAFGRGTYRNHAS